MSEDEYLKGIMAKTAARKAALSEPKPMTPPTKAMLELANITRIILFECSIFENDAEIGANPNHPDVVKATRAAERILALRSSQNGERERVIEEHLNRARSFLMGAMVASCDCNTKTHEISYHKELCRYRKICEAISEIDRVINPIRALKTEGKGA